MVKYDPMQKLEIPEKLKTVLFQEVYAGLVYRRDLDSSYLEHIGLCAIVSEAVIHIHNSYPFLCKKYEESQLTMYLKIIKYMISNLPLHKKLYLRFKANFNYNKMHINQYWWGKRSTNNDRKHRETWYNPRIKFWVKLAKKNNIKLKKG